MVGSLLKIDHDSEDLRILALYQKPTFTARERKAAPREYAGLLWFFKEFGFVKDTF